MLSFVMFGFRPYLWRSVEEAANRRRKLDFGTGHFGQCCRRARTVALPRVIQSTPGRLPYRCDIGPIAANQGARAEALDVIHVEILIEVARNTDDRDSVHQRLLTGRTPAVAHDRT